jgi:hypothetical protein
LGPDLIVVEAQLTRKFSLTIAVLILERSAQVFLQPIK